MSDRSKAMPTFNFGNVGGSGATSPGVFGSDNNAPSNIFSPKPDGQGGNIFGASTLSTTSAPSYFSAPAGATSNTAQPSILGASTGNSPSLFGNTSSATTAQNTGSIFSTFSTPNKLNSPTAIQTPQISNMFASGEANNTSNPFANLAVPTSSNQAGTTTPAPSKPAGGFSFGDVSTTPAGPPPSGNAGPGTSGRSIFNFKPQEPKSNLFGPSLAQGSSQTPTTNATTSTSFGGFNPAGTSNIFGASQPIASNAPTTAASASSGTFGANQLTSTAPNILGSNSAASASGAQVSTSIFGTTQPAPSSSNLFGTTPAASSASSGPSFFAPQSHSREPSATPLDEPPGQNPFNLFNTGNQSLFTPAPQSAPSSFFGSTPQSAVAASTKPSFKFPSQSTQSVSTASTAPTAAIVSALSKPSVNLGAATPGASTTTGAPSSSLFSPQGNPKPTESIAKQSLGTSAPSGSAPAASTTASSLFPGLKTPAEAAGSQAGKQPSKTATTDDGTKAPTLGASTAGPRPAPQSRLKNKSMDEIITRWASDLSKYQKEFQKQAEKVAQWDRMLVENSEKVQKLYGSTLEAERATAEVERQLSVVENDQAELEYWLDHYEKQVDEMAASQAATGDALQGPGSERERTFQLAEKLSDRLDEMGKDLTSMIEEINDASSNLSKNSKADDPLSQIVRVLNGHLSQLQQIDQGTAALQAKVAAAQRASRSIGSSNGVSGLGSDPADEFYKSYMGRKR